MSGADAEVGERFTAEEQRLLAPYFTNVERPVFALRNLPEVVKAALFARYSRSPKSLRRLFLDEFLDSVEAAGGPDAVGVARAEKLFQRVLSEYGDDSVAQLGGAHVAVEGASNLLTKVLEWGRLMAYLEQSTRYIPYTQRDGGRWRYVIPAELRDAALRSRYVACLDRAFETYARLIEPATEHFRRALPQPEGVSDAAHRATARAKALDALRGLLPAATRSNVGIFGSGQGYEHLILRMRAHPLAEARECAEAMLVELREVIPAFLTRVDRDDRGGVWTRYLAETRAATKRVADDLFAGIAPEPRDDVTLTEFDREGEVKVVAAALYAASHLPDDQVLERVRAMSVEQRSEVLRAYVGERRNRRHKPGRAFERTSYRFDVVGDYGAFRDLQRHRLLTIEWQDFSPELGHITSEVVDEIDAGAAWRAVMQEAADLHRELRGAGVAGCAAYALPMAYRLRFCIEMNAREAMHLIELRTTPQGHPAYRAIAQEMHRLIDERAGHRAIAAAMRFADHSAGEQGRLQAERMIERKRTGR